MAARTGAAEVVTVTTAEVAEAMEAVKRAAVERAVAVGVARAAEAVGVVAAMAAAWLAGRRAVAVVAGQGSVAVAETAQAMEAAWKGAAAVARAARAVALVAVPAAAVAMGARRSNGDRRSPAHHMRGLGARSCYRTCGSTPHAHRTTRMRHPMAARYQNKRSSSHHPHAGAPEVEAMAEEPQVIQCSSGSRGIHGGRRRIPTTTRMYSLRRTAGSRPHHLHSIHNDHWSSHTHHSTLRDRA